QLLLDYFNQPESANFVQKQNKHSELLSFDSTKQIQIIPSEEGSIHNIISVQSASSFINKDDEELHQLRENIVTLTNKCTGIDEANHAWQLFQQARHDNFRKKLHDYFTLDENLSFNQIAHIIINQQYEILQKKR
ncbi:unnamed protein product, partial [Rotaria sp. Silwood2]